MKKHLLFLLLLMSVWMMAACGGGRNRSDSCRLTAKVEFPEFTQAYLTDGKGQVLDTLPLQNGQIDFVCTDTSGMPYVAFVSLANPLDSLDRMDMPVMMECGKVNVEIGEYIVTSGTPLNVRLQEFLNDLQATRDAIKESTVPTADVLKSFSEFYRQQILSNRDNVVGRFIFRQYGFHLTPEDAALVKAQLGN